MARANSKERVIEFVLAQPHRISATCLTMHKTLNSHTFIYDDKPNGIYRERVVPQKYLSNLDLDEWIALGVSFVSAIGEELAAQSLNRLSGIAKASRDALGTGVSFDLGERIARLYSRLEGANINLVKCDPRDEQMWIDRKTEACEALFAIGIQVIGYEYGK